MTSSNAWHCDRIEDREGSYMSAREYLEREVRERAHHATAEEVRTTCSFARAERLIGREYHGRFLIELLQNAADAWRNDLRSLNGNHSRVSVLLAEGPALIVANQGAPMSAEVVIESLGHIGASTKSEGEAIGHKGIGFKSVLEITHAPEIYSGLQDDSLKLAVRFDPELAYSTITDSSPHWSELLSNVRSSDEHDELAAVPVLRFPHWVDELPTAVADLAAEGFDTVVLLPFNASPANRVELDEDSWLVTVRRALADISDQILVLLGCFSEVAIDDRLGGIREVIAPSWQIDSESGGSDYTRELVQVLRNGDLSSRWRLFRKSLPEIENLAGEIAVGIRIDGVSTPGALVPTADREVSAPFHLFFPTRIASGLPFLLHGYFEVDAARTGFYRGSESRNKSILHELAALTAEAVRDNAHSGDADVVTVVNLVAAAGDPEDPLARDFRADVLDRLDAFDWIPASPERDNLRTERPSGLFVCRPELTRHVAAVFPQTYVAMRVDLSLPDIRLSDAALDLIRLRRTAQTSGTSSAHFFVRGRSRSGKAQTRTEGSSNFLTSLRHLRSRTE
jgi:hypothetical protein